MTRMENAISKQAQAVVIKDMRSRGSVVNSTSCQRVSLGLGELKNSRLIPTPEDMDAMQHPDSSHYHKPQPAPVFQIRPDREQKPFISPFVVFQTVSQYMGRQTMTCIKVHPSRSMRCHPQGRHTGKGNPTHPLAQPDLRHRPAPTSVRFGLETQFISTDRNTSEA